MPQCGSSGHPFFPGNTAANYARRTGKTNNTLFQQLIT